ncbi:MAG: aldose epimerase family protein [Planctomycetota bacterium]
MARRGWYAAPLVALAIVGFGCSFEDDLVKRPFGIAKDGRPVELYTLRNARGMEVDIATYGGTVVSVRVPDRAGKTGDVVLGFSTLAEYEAKSPYFGCIVGRYGNRIANGKFSLDGVEHTLATNDQPGGVPCHLHGGKVGFDKKVWQADPVRKSGARGLRLRHRSPDGDEGYPGNLDVAVTYWLTDANELRIEYEARTDQATPVNLTNHSYFNLKGEGEGDVNGHVLKIAASRFTPVTKGLIPTGELRPVEGTPFDFREPRSIGERLGAEDEQLAFGGGYDHNFALDKEPGAFALTASAYEPATGRTLEVWTTEPGIQFYGGNFLDGTLAGKSGRTYAHRGGFCLETQHFPDSPNQPRFPSTILRPGETYRSATAYKFGTKA